MGQFSDPVATHPRTNEVEVPPRPTGCASEKMWEDSLKLHQNDVFTNLSNVNYFFKHAFHDRWILLLSFLDIIRAFQVVSELSLMMCGWFTYVYNLVC